MSSDVGWTALLTAYSRAQETRRAGSRLVEDPYAAEFIAAYTGEVLDPAGALPDLGPAGDRGSSLLWKIFEFYIPQRTPFFDQAILRAQGICRQIVLLGAGLDTRAFRLELGPETTVFEVDRPTVFAFKDRVLNRLGATSTCSRVEVAADLAAEGLGAALTAAGFDPTRPAVFVAEGLLMYLTDSAADALLSQVSALAAPGSVLLGEHYSRRFTDADASWDLLDDTDRITWRQLTSSWAYGLVGQEPAAVLTRHGWTPGEVTDLAGLGRGAGRAVPPAFGAQGAGKVWLYEGIRTGDSDVPALKGIHHLKIPVEDLDRSLAFYERAFGARRIPEADHVRPGGTLFAYIVRIDGLGTLLELRRHPDRARSHSGFDPITLLVDDRTALAQWAGHLDRAGLAHSPVLTAVRAWVMVVPDPDGTRIRLYTSETHGPELAPDTASPWLDDAADLEPVVESSPACP
ncbi:SAM-dependent methyltransferase [Paractinoplanes atraurantiacus]|uniref:Methyltransferase, TIGR00027 family n=1 Tax=Paractinoplanes atraurantiacus TaxID=1036182 RepID=A0A285IKW9_9ACTN|nr:SAM-dependent methyltransferase [Actinoplanes atraurantiacus]SNY47631.1 methyltransferase, TIGR00027 family [Actinoplanes atraurantiacus]